MGRYLDLSIERKTEEGWKHLYSASYEEGMELINCCILRDLFSETECYSSFGLSTLADETIINLGIKIEENGVFMPIKKDSVCYPYRYRRVETLVGDSLSKDKIIDKLKRMSRDIKIRFNDTIVLVKPECLDDAVSIGVTMSAVGLKNGIKFPCPWNACFALKADMKLKDKDWFNGIAYCEYYDDDGKEVKQYAIPQTLKISTYKDLICMKEGLEKDIAKAEESMSDDARLSKILADRTTSVAEDDWSTSLGRIVKELMSNEPLISYTTEELDELKAQKSELEKLILMVDENGRVVWSIS